MKLQELNINTQQKTSEQQAVEKATKEILTAEGEANMLLGECSVMGDMMGIVVDYEEAEDDVISSGMRSLVVWQEQMNTIERVFRKYENTKDNFSTDRQEAIQLIYDEHRDKFQKEDADRGLYTLEPARSDIIKYPGFSGSASEDLLKLIETMQQRFKENKVKKKEQVKRVPYRSSTWESARWHNRY